MFSGGIKLGILAWNGIETIILLQSQPVIKSSKLTIEALE